MKMDVGVDCLIWGSTSEPIRSAGSVKTSQRCEMPFQEASQESMRVDVLLSSIKEQKRYHYSYDHFQNNMMPEF